MNQIWNTPSPANDLTWEPQSADGRAATDRAAVQGGWLYRATAYSDDADPIAVALCFVPEAAPNGMEGAAIRLGFVPVGGA